MRLLTRCIRQKIERYEDEHHPIPDVSGHEVLSFLLEERGLKQSDLLPVIKSRGIISELVNGKRPIGLSVAKKLGEFFNINPEVFLIWDRNQSIQERP